MTRLTREEYEFLEFCRLWGRLPSHKQDRIAGYVRHKRAAGFGLGVIPLAALFYFILQLIRK